MNNFFKPIVTAMLLFLFLSGTIVAQKESIATATGPDKGVNIDLPAPFSTRVFAGTIHANVDGNATSLYCIDLNHTIVYNQAYQDVSATDIYMSHILNNYYPYVSYPYSGSLSTVNKEAAAVQVALWYFSDGLNVNALTDTEIKNRALQIISDANTNAHTVLPTDVLLIVPPSQSAPTNIAVSFVVAAYDEFGNPLAGRTISLSASNGSLSASSVVTNANGISNSIIFTPNNGVTSAVITAESNLTIPAGTKYFHVANPNGYQKLILAKPTFASKTVTSTISYYTPQICDLNGYTTFTYTQGGWGSPNNSGPGTIRRLYFNSVFPSGLTIGYGSNTATFTSSDAIKNYLPAGGTPGTLTGALINPTSTSAGVLGGQVTALSMNVYFSAFGVLGNNPTPLGNLVIVSGPFAGLTVNQFLNIANQALGGVNTGYSLSAINDAATAINENFNGNNTNNGYLTCAPQVASIGDRVWLDANQNGIQDAGEAGAANVTVKLYNSANVLQSTTITDANGYYSFTNLAPGNYYVQFVLPSGYSFSPKDQGLNDAVDSDADVLNGKTDVTNLIAGENDMTWDAGIFVTPASIGDRVWLDANMNGIQDAGESGFANITVKLYNSSNVLVGTTTTNVNGNYFFTNLTPGDYYVEFMLPSGYFISPKDQGSNDAIDSDADVVTRKTALTTLSPGENDLTWDAGMYPIPATVGDKVWIDSNMNGIQDAGEPGLANVVVKLYDCNDNLISTLTTGANGNYLFTNIIPGSYYLQFITPAGYTITVKDAGSNDGLDSDVDPATGKTDCFTLAPGDFDITRDAGVHLMPASIGDRVWLDNPFDGIQDAGEPGFPNVTVKLYNSSDVLVATTTTDANGNYSFTNLIPGDYYLEFILPPDYRFTNSDIGNDDAIDSDVNVTTGRTVLTTLSPGENDMTWDAGIHLIPVNIGDRVWNDENADGIQDSNEGPFVMLTVELYDCSDNLIATTTTGAGGHYFFTNLPPGSYYVKFDVPPGYTFTIPNAGSDDTKDSDADPNTGKSPCITLLPGQNDYTIDAGFTLIPQPVNIGDKVWLDANQDGVQDAGEAGLPNVTVKLYNCSDVLVATTTTDANGIYSFTNIPAGSYYVKFELPSGYVFSPANTGSDDEVDSDADQVTGQTACMVFTGGTTNNSIDAGMYLGGANLSITKVADDNQVDCGQNVAYTITVTNNGPLTANTITVSDVLPAGLVFLNSNASQGSYDNNTGVWTVGTLANGASATLSIGVQVDCGALNNSSIDLGPASDYNVFVLENINLPSSDTQGKMAAGGNISLSNYSVGDVLTPNSNQDVLVAGGNLYFTSGGIYGGNVAYGGTSNLPTNAVTIFHGTVRHDANVIDFVAAKTYLENLSTTLGGYAANGTVVKEWGSVNMTGNDPFLNVFSVNTADITAAHTVNITVPNGSVVLVNMVGTSIDWKGGLFVNGTAVGNVIYNFPQGTNLRISGIDIRGSILAPFADVNFVAGVQHGQMIAKNITGQGQYNLSPFHGNIPSSNVINIASITGSDQTDPVSGNNSASATITLASQSGGGSGSGNWQLVGNLPVGEVVTTLESENNGNILAGTVNGYIYRTTDNGTTWTRINNDMYSGPIWGIEKHANGNILVATVTGVYMSTNNGASWQLTDLQYKDVRALKIASNGDVYAGTWGFGMYLSTNNGISWAQVNTGLGSNLIITSITIAPNQDVYAGTFGGGLFKTVNQGANWTAVNTGHDFIWVLGRNSNGDIFAGTYGDGLYKSVNNGATWTKTPFPGGFVYELIIDASDNIFASSYAGGVFVSTDNGTTWTNIGMGGMGLSSMMIVPNSRRIYTGTANGKIYMQTDNTTGVNSESREIPTEFKLSQNYPNPFNPSTSIEVKIAKAGYFKLAVYDMTGQLVATLIDGQLEAGVYRPVFEAGNLPSGIYIYKLVGDNINFSNKMVLVK